MCCMRRIKVAVLSILICLLGTLTAQQKAVHKVQFTKNSQGDWRVYINGKETPIHGAGGVFKPGMLEQFSSVGGNFTRTWGIGSLETKVSDGKNYIDRAHELGVNVMAGIWIAHERHGFNYSDPEKLKEQRERVRAGVRKWKHHPGIAIWGLGNEMEGPQAESGNTAVYKELEVLAKIIKEEDPNRPIMTVIAGTRSGKIRNLMKHCPTIDAVGINAYGAAAAAGKALKKVGWKKPFAITEFGVKGFWEAQKTSWGAPIEPTSTEKSKTYYSTHKLVTSMNDGKELCMGTFAFVWGWKQEKTSTWFGMCLSTGEKLAQVDTLVKAWTGKWPANRAPKIKTLKASFFGKTVSKDSKLIARVDAEDPENNPMSYEWIIVKESTSNSVGGDYEWTPPSFPELTLENNKPQCVAKAPANTGQYRLFLTVRDGKGSAATANIPFQVK